MELADRRAIAEEFVRENKEFRYRKLPLGLIDLDTREDVFAIGVFQLQPSFMTVYDTDGLHTNATLVAIECPPNASEKIRRLFETEKDGIEKRKWAAMWGTLKLGGEPVTVAKLVKSREEAEKQ